MRAAVDLIGSVAGTHSDVVMLTDGQCAVSEAFHSWYLDQQHSREFTTYAVVIGGDPKAEPLNRLCNGKVWSVRDLATGSEIQPLFRRL